MSKLRIKQEQIFNLSLDFMTDQVWHAIESARQQNPNTFPCIRYTSENRFEEYRKGQEAWAKMKNASEEDRVSFLRQFGVEGGKYKNASNNHYFDENENYMFLFPTKNRSDVKQCLRAIIETKLQDPEANTKTYNVGAFLLDNKIKAKYTNRGDKESGLGGGDYTVDGELVHLEELALNTRDYDPNSLITKSITTDIYTNLLYFAESRELDISDIETLRIVAEEEHNFELRDFCDYMAASRGISFDSQETEKEELVAHPNGTVLLDESKISATQREIREIIESAREFDQSPEEIKELLLAYGSMGPDAGGFDMSDIEAVATSYKIDLGSTKSQSKKPQDEDPCQ